MTTSDGPETLFVSKWPADDEPGVSDGLATLLLALPRKVMMVVSIDLKGLLRPSSGYGDRGRV